MPFAYVHKEGSKRIISLSPALPSQPYGLAAYVYQQAGERIESSALTPDNLSSSKTVEITTAQNTNTSDVSNACTYNGWKAFDLHSEYHRMLRRTPTELRYALELQQRNTTGSELAAPTPLQVGYPDAEGGEGQSVVTSNSKEENYYDSMLQLFHKQLIEDTRGEVKHVHHDHLCERHDNPESDDFSFHQLKAHRRPVRMHQRRAESEKKKETKEKKEPGHPEQVFISQRIQSAIVGGGAPPLRPPAERKVDTPNKRQAAQPKVERGRVSEKKEQNEKNREQPTRRSLERE